MSSLVGSVVSQYGKLPTTTITLGTVDAADPVLIDGSVVYTFTVTNTGAKTAYDIVLTVTPDVTLTFVSTTKGAQNIDLTTVVVALAAGLAASGTATVVMTFTAPHGAQTVTTTSAATCTNATTATDSETTVIAAA